MTFSGRGNQDKDNSLGVGRPSIDDDNSRVCGTVRHFLVSKALSSILSSNVSCDSPRRRPDSWHPLFANDDNGVRKLGSFAQDHVHWLRYIIGWGHRAPHSMFFLNISSHLQCSAVYTFNPHNGSRVGSYPFSCYYYESTFGDVGYSGTERQDVN